MSHYYAKIHESARKHMPTARGHYAIGTKTMAYDGVIEVMMSHEGKDGDDHYTVWLVPHPEGPQFPPVKLADGYLQEHHREQG